MRRFWDRVIRPLVSAMDPGSVLEIGAQSGALTERLLEHFAGTSTVVHSVDPLPKLDVAAWQEVYGGDRFVFHEAKSLEVLGELPPFDLVLIDGDHNWYTLFHELRALERATAEHKGRFPLVLCHDAAWPYARRDMYYDPDDIPPGFLHPHAQRGMVPGLSRLADDDGLNRHLHNAAAEGTPRNGVLTAIEDFAGASSLELDVRTLPGMNGLALLVSPEHAGDAALKKVLRSFESARFMRALVETVESERLCVEIQGQKHRIASDALGATREELAAVATERRKLATRTGELADELSAARVERDRHAEAVGRLEEERRALAEKDERLTAELDAARVEAAAEQARLAGELDAARVEAAAEQARFTRELGDAAAEQARLAHEIDAAAAEHARLTRELGDATDERARLARRLDDAEHEVERLAREGDRLRAVERDLQGTVSRLEAAQAEQDERVGAAEYEARRLGRRVDERKADADRAASQLRAGQGSAAALAESLRAIRDDVDRLGESKAWRWGHAVTRAARRLTFRRNVGRGAVDRLLERAGAAGESADRLAAELAPRVAPSKPAPVRDLDPASDEVHAEAESVHPPIADDEEERARHEALMARIAAEARDETWQPEARSVPTDHFGILVESHEDDTARPSVDVVVCVHDALDDVQRCLWSLLERPSYAFGLIVVDDGSQPETAHFLARMRDRNPATRIVTNDSDRHGYTVAANLGLRASTADYVVLLNSDTVVTQGWLERIVACGESDPAIGVIGPLSNAASHQSVPRTREGGAWASNELPPWLTTDAMAVLVAECSNRDYPRFPFVNGFCYAIKRDALEQVGLFDEELFERGYCEENDFSYRASQAGFELAIADDAYVFHAKSGSYSSDGRTALAKDHYRRFLLKHGEERIGELVAGLEQDRSLEPLRHALTPSFDDEAGFQSRFRELFPDPLEVAFVLPGLADGSSGGAHSVYQEVRAMCDLGIPAWIALDERAWERAARAYADVDEVFVPYADGDDLASKMSSADIAVATHFSSVRLVRPLVERRPELLAAYYVQDYEPLFVDVASPAYREALESYAAIPGHVFFAKTWWLCEYVTRARGVRVRKVEPSLDHEIFHASPDRVPATAGRPLQVAAMVRPRTPRRNAALTLRILAELGRQLGAEVRAVSFGCSDAQLATLGVPRQGDVDHRGVLTRAEVGALLRESDVFVDCSVYQAFGRTALEAMACGCVPVVPAVGGQREFALDDANAVVTDTATAQGVLAAVRTPLEDRPRLERLRAGAIETAARYSTTRAALSEYLMFEEEHRRRHAEGDEAREASSVASAAATYS